jgi:RNA polymerase sigma factor (sigma-70 family)
MDGHTRESRFESLYSAYGGEVLGYALRQGVERADAEDIVVDTFLVCWRRLDDVPQAALPWLLGVARRLLANQRRGKKRHSALYAKIEKSLREPSPPLVNGRVDPSELEVALGSLSEGDREVVALVVWQGLTHEAAAQVLGCSRNTLTKRYLRACCKLRAQLPAIRTLNEYREEASPSKDMVSR